MSEEEMIAEFKKDTKDAIRDLWREINKIKDRPSAWTALIIAVLTGLLGYKFGKG